MKDDSSLFESGINCFSSLPGIGRKSALRMVLHVLKKDKEYAEQFAQTISELKTRINPCETCGNYTEHRLCEICKNPSRNEKLICVVESIRDVLAIEETGHYKGVYHVLGGLISPLDGIGPEELRIAELVHRIHQSKEGIELIMAISPSIDGETTSFYIGKQVENLNCSMSLIARGVSFGGELQYTDELTLSKSIDARRPFMLHGSKE